jgi:hypothetical protein
MADTLDVGNTTGTAQLHANAFVDDPFVRFLSPPEVVVTVTMKKK